MKKTIVIALLLLAGITLKAQINQQLIYGSWIKVKVTFTDNVELPNIVMRKYSYTRYTFSKTGKINIATVYNTYDSENNFGISDNIITVTNSAGYVMHEMRIDTLTADELILTDKGEEGFNDPQTLKTYFIPEVVFQRRAKFNTNEIGKLANGDTVYTESPKVYAKFKGSQNMQAYLSAQNVSMEGQEGYFKASFIVSKTGMVDSFKIISGINNDYDKAAVKWFNKNKKNWLPAILNGKAVNVKRIQEARYFTSARIEPTFRLDNDLKDALVQGNYQLALYFYNKALKILPDNITYIYCRAACKIVLNDADGLCDDLAKVQASGTMLLDGLIDKYCRPVKK